MQQRVFRKAISNGIEVGVGRKEEGQGAHFSSFSPKRPLRIPFSESRRVGPSAVHARSGAERSRLTFVRRDGNAAAF